MSTLAATALKHASSTSNNIILTSGGLVGIGNSAPAAALHVYSGATDEVTRFESTGNPYISLYDTNVRQGYFYSAGGSVQLVAENSKPLQLITSGAQELSLYTNNIERARITSGGDLQFNSGYGSVATAYGCRAWVNFNGTGVLAIRSSGNISSITDNGVGDFTVNFTNALPDANYSVQFSTDGPVNTAHCVGFVSGSVRNLFSTTQVAIATHILTNSATRADPSYGQVAVFR